MKALAAVVVMTLLLLYVGERVEIVRAGYQIERLKSKKIALQREYDELQVKISALTAPERIARVATEKLGMISPQQGQVVLVRIESQETLPGMAPKPEIKLAKSDLAGGLR